MSSDLLQHVAALPCFCRRSNGCLDAVDKLLLMELVMQFESSPKPMHSRALHLTGDAIGFLKRTTSLGAPRFESAIRRLDRDRFIELLGPVEDDRVDVFVPRWFE